jgi:hypothetical protein
MLNNNLTKRSMRAAAVIRSSSVRFSSPATFYTGFTDWTPRTSDL